MPLTRRNSSTANLRKRLGNLSSDQQNPLSRFQFELELLDSPFAFSTKEPGVTDSAHYEGGVYDLAKGAIPAFENELRLKIKAFNEACTKPGASLASLATPLSDLLVVVQSYKKYLETMLSMRPESRGSQPQRPQLQYVEPTLLAQLKELCKSRCEALLDQATSNERGTCCLFFSTTRKRYDFTAPANNLDQIDISNYGLLDRCTEQPDKRHRLNSCPASLSSNLSFTIVHPSPRASDLPAIPEHNQTLHRSRSLHT